MSTNNLQTMMIINQINDEIKKLEYSSNFNKEQVVKILRMLLKHVFINVKGNLIQV